jgi:uncharacterized protein YeaO (DUF488 family)
MDIEKAIQFILNQQARSEADFATWRAQFREELIAQGKRAEQQLIEIRNVLLEVGTYQARMSEMLIVAAERHNDLAERHDSLTRTVERQSDEWAARLAASEEERKAMHREQSAAQLELVRSMARLAETVRDHVARHP